MSFLNYSFYFIFVSGSLLFSQNRQSTTLVYPPIRHAPIHKATNMHLFAFMALIGRTDITPSDPQGMAVTRLKSTDDPANNSDNDDLTAYGINAGQSNIIFNSSMQSLDVYEGKGRKQKLKKPRGIAANPDGDVYVTDTGNHRIVKLNNPGNYLTFVDAYGEKGSREGEFNNPRGIALDAAGNVYVADTDNNRVQVFDRAMKFLHCLGQKKDSSSYELFRPDGIAVASAGDDLFYKEEFLIVIDLNNSRISKLTLDGKFTIGIHSNDYGYPSVFLTSVALDFYDNIWVTDMFNHCIHKFDRNLRYLTSFGHIGDGENEFFEPRSIAIWKKFGQVFIADKNSAQYFHIGTDIIKTDVFSQDSLIRFDFFLTENSKITAVILDERGNALEKICSNKLMMVGENVLTWDRKKRGTAKQGLSNLWKRVTGDSLAQKTQSDSSNAAVNYPSGIYKLRLEAKTTYIYNRYFTKTKEIEFAL